LHRKLDGERRYESEASRLMRCIRALGDADLEDPANWDLALTTEEIRKRESVLATWRGGEYFIAVSIGTKADAKDWGERNWQVLLERISRFDPNLGLVMIGASDEKDASDRAARSWRGPALNLCGMLSTRESAAVIGRANSFVGHDSGPMHLAAALGVPCTAVFSARNKPGVWFPFGVQSRVIYHQTECFGCELVECKIHQKKCITSISVDEVFGYVMDMLKTRWNRPSQDQAH
jgi:ADP-heptose:LPS heptosyltransferase